MRTLILFLLILAPDLTQANHDHARTWSNTGFVADGAFKIKVFVNGRALNYRPQFQVNGVRLRPGNHRVRVVAYGPRRTIETRELLTILPRRPNRFAVRSAGRRGGLYLDPVIALDNHHHRRGRLHDEPALRHQTDFCDEARYFDVDRLVDLMNCERFDGRKIQLAKNAIRRSSLFAYDLQYIMEQVAFDESKVEIAAFAYSRVCNPDEFYVVFDALTYQSSVKRLKRATGYH